MLSSLYGTWNHITEQAMRNPRVCSREADNAAISLSIYMYVRMRVDYVIASMMKFSKQESTIHTHRYVFTHTTHKHTNTLACMCSVLIMFLN